MASYTVSSSVDHVLPAKFWGLYTALFDMDTDGPNATFQQLAKDLRMEVWRLHPNQSHRFWTPGDPVVAGMQTFILAVQATGGTKTLVQVPGAPANYPADSLAPWDPTNVRSGSDPRSPASVATGVASLIASGVDVGWVEIFNETVLSTASASGSDGWYVNGYSGLDAGTANFDWGVYFHRNYVNAVRAVAPNVRIVGLAAANARLEVDSAVTAFIDGTIPGGHGPGSNATYFDSISFHPYAQPSDTNGNGITGDTQATLNGIIYSPDAANKATWCFDTFRADLDARSLQAKTLCTTEQSIIGRTDEIGALADVLYAIRAANRQKDWNLEFITYTEYDAAGLGGLFASQNAPYGPTCRYYTLRDMVGPFLREYKQIASTTTTVAPGNTPASGTNNSGPRIQRAEGFNPDGNLGIFVANADLVTSEQATFAMPAIPLGPVTGKKLAAGSSAPTDIGQITVTGTSITTGSGGIPSLGQGEALLLRAPLKQSITIPPPPPPPPTTNAKIGTLSDNFNGNSVSNLWRNVPIGTSTLADTNQRLEITTLAGPTFDWLQLAIDDNNQIGIRQNGANIEAFKIVGGATTSLSLAASTAGLYFQILEAAGTTFWEYGADPAGSFTTLFSVANPVVVTGLQARIGSGTGTDWAELQSVNRYDLTSDRIFLQYFQTGSASQPTVFDNCNTAAVSLTDLGPWSDVVQINATDPVSPAVVPDFGPWSDVVQINAVYAHPEHVGSIPIVSEEG